MKLSLSTAASPGVALDVLDAACRARGLDGLELVVEEHHDIVSSVRVVALRSERFDERTARLSAALGVPVSVPFEAAVGNCLIDVGTNLDRALEVVEAIRGTSLGIAWELRPSSEDLGAASAVLLAIRAHLRLVRLYGGGPEQHDQDGLGVGSLFVELALAGYRGPIVLTPSSAREQPRWLDWLSSRKSAGCGSARQHIDIREVEPKDRLGTILGAYRALPRGATLKITFDHDPSCMYYALEASEPEGSFAFQKLGDGPEVWRAEVTKN